MSQSTRAGAQGISFVLRALLTFKVRALSLGVFVWASVLGALLTETARPEIGGKVIFLKSSLAERSISSLHLFCNQSSIN